MKFLRKISHSFSPTFQRRYAQSFKLRDALVDLKTEGFVSISTIDAKQIKSGSDLIDCQYLQICSLEKLGLKILIASREQILGNLSNEIIVHYVNQLLKNHVEETYTIKRFHAFLSDNGGDAYTIKLRCPHEQFYDAPCFYPELRESPSFTLSTDGHDLYSKEQMKEKIRDKIAMLRNKTSEPF